MAKKGKQYSKISGTWEQIKPSYNDLEDVPSTFTPTSHTHGNVGNTGLLEGTGVAIATGDHLVIADNSGSDKLEKTTITFDTNITNTYLRSDGTWATIEAGGISKEDLQNLYIYGKASGAITKGQAVQFAGAQGGHILIKPAVPSEINAEPTLMVGIAETDLANNEFGYVIVNGRLNLNTSAYDAGDLLYFASAGTVAGALTTTEPTDPNASIQMAVVSIDGIGNGEFLVRKTILTRQINEVNGLQGALDGKAALSHTHAISAITNLQTSLDAKQDDLGTGSNNQFLRWGALGVPYWDTVTANEVGAAATSHTHTIANVTGLQTALDSKATPSDISTAVSNLVDSSPATLDTLNELAAALGDDPNFATTITTALGGKMSTSHPANNITSTHLYMANGDGFVWNDTTNVMVVRKDGTDYEVIDSGNIGSQSVSYATSAGSTTGNAATATKLATARNIALTGDVTGNANFDGSANISITATVADDSHNHVWGNIDGGSVNSWGGLRHSTASGYIDFGPANTSYAHIYTDRPAFYFDKNILVNGTTLTGNTGTVTSVATGGGLTGGTITTSGTISHADTSTAATLTASGRRYVTGLTFDTYGHVTGYTTGTETVVDTNTTYGLAGTAISGLVRLGAVAANVTVNGPSSTAGRYYPVASSTNGNLYVNVPWVDTNTTYTLGSFGVTSTAAELNVLDGITATTTELNYTDGVTSNIQTQLNGKAASSHTHSAADITSGTLGVARGGTGATTFTSGNVLVGAGTGAVTTLSRSGIDSRTSFPPSGHDINFHSDVSVSSPTSGQVLKWNGTAWTNQADANTDTNNYLTGVSGSGNGTVTFTRTGLSNLTWNAAHSHSNYLPIAGAPYYSPVANSILTYNTTYGWLTQTVGYWQPIRSRADATSLTSTGCTGTTGGSISAGVTLAQGDTIMMEVSDASPVSAGYTTNLVTFILGAADTTPNSIQQGVSYRSAYSTSTTSYMYHFKVGFSNSTLYFDDSFRVTLLDTATATNILANANALLHIGRIWRLNE